MPHFSRRILQCMKSLLMIFMESMGLHRKIPCVIWGEIASPEMIGTEKTIVDILQEKRGIESIYRVIFE